MTLVLQEGFDLLTASSTLFSAKGWQAIIGTGSPDSVVSGRFSPGSAIQFNGGLSSEIGKNLPSAYTTLIFGVAFKVSAVNTDFLHVRVSAGGSNIFSCGVNASGKLIVGGLTGMTTISTGVWYYLEVKAVIAGAAGSLTAQLNGVTEIVTTTTNIGSTAAGCISLFSSGSSVVTTLDDIYVLDGSIAPNNSFLGDVRVETIRPNADGAHTQWTPDTGTAHYSRVNETTPDGDTSYVYDLNIGDRDSYTFDDLVDLSGTIFGIQTNLYARKDNTALRQICAVARPVTTDRDGATVTLASSYQFFSEIRETNPDTGVAWTIGDINSSEFGVKVVA